MPAADHPLEPAAADRRPVQEAIRLLRAMSERLRQHFIARAAEFDLSEGQAKVLLELRPEEALPMGALAGRLNYDASNLTGLIDRLEARAALRRRPDPIDRRIKALVLTEEGLRLQENLWRRLFEAGGPIGSLSDAQTRQLCDLLRVALAQI